ncbi:hypothetical protein N7470_001446 [Penicillium chermesinum]|nr:hypothetical protein N7470_001446 [Penicillium chermesinum]
MFGWGSALALPSAASEPEKERNPPPHPTPLDFPECQLPDVVTDQSDSRLHELFHLLADIKRPQDISIHRFKPLNLKVDNNVEPWEPEPESPRRGRAPTPRDEQWPPLPPKDKYEVLHHELLLDNDDVFREVARLPVREGRDRVRVTQTRKFWASLERMSQYWDNSIDNYFERPASPEPTPPVDDEHATEDKMEVDRSETKTPAATSDGEPPPRPVVSRYTGRRIGSGVEMPDDVRDETVRSFVEMAAWPFGCQVTVPTLPPRLTVRSLLFPVRQSFQVARSPRDRTIARNGILEGPVLIAQCRPETGFRTDGETPGEGLGEVCDLFREVGGMLLAAQERAREGALKVRPGEGKWWTMAPRFGGAPNDGILDDLMKGPGIHGIPIPESLVEGSLSSASQDLSTARRRPHEHPFMTSLARRPSAMRKLTSTEKWKIIQPGPSLWDKRMKYMQIGKDKGSPFDDIYMISSINHHIAILHLRVHRRYLDILTHGESTFPETSDGSDQPWHVLKLQRTRWYDLLDANDRVEALKGVWSLFHYQQRKTDD